MEIGWQVAKSKAVGDRITDLQQVPAEGSRNAGPRSGCQPIEADRRRSSPSWSPSRSRSEGWRQQRGPDRRNRSRPGSRLSRVVQPAGRSSRQRRIGLGATGSGSRGKGWRRGGQGRRSRGASRARVRPGRKSPWGSITAAGVQSSAAWFQAVPARGVQVRRILTGQGPHASSETVAGVGSAGRELPRRRGRTSMRVSGCQAEWRCVSLGMCPDNPMRGGRQACPTGRVSVASWGGWVRVVDGYPLPLGVGCTWVHIHMSES